MAADVGVPLQMVRSPEEALRDELLVADGCVVEVDDPELGAVASGWTASTHYPRARANPPHAGCNRYAHKGGDRRGGIAAAGAAPNASAFSPIASPGGVRVLDLGLAVAGPFGAQLLADLGADVIKINALSDGYWFGSHLAMACNRGKRSISINLKDPGGYATLERLVRSVDVVHHNMRYDTADNYTSTTRR